MPIPPARSTASCQGTGALVWHQPVSRRGGRPSAKAHVGRERVAHRESGALAWRHALLLHKVADERLVDSPHATRVQSILPRGRDGGVCRSSAPLIVLQIDDICDCQADATFLLRRLCPALVVRCCVTPGGRLRRWRGLALCFNATIHVPHGAISRVEVDGGGVVDPWGATPEETVARCPDAQRLPLDEAKDTHLDASLHWSPEVHRLLQQRRVKVA